MERGYTKNFEDDDLNEFFVGASDDDGGKELDLPEEEIEEDETPEELEEDEDEFE